jgi:uncharacterized protein YggT (Ycf19 family)
MEHRDADIDRQPGTGQVHERSVVTEPGVAPAESEVVNTFNPSWRATQLVYLVFGVIDGLLLIRLVLKLLGANPLAGFASFVYSVSDFFLVPFKNLLPTIGNEHSMLEMSLVVAVLVYALLGWAMARLVEVIFYRNVTVSRRSRGLRPRGF